MDESTREIRVIEFSEAATLDLAGIDNSTAQQWSEEQADGYLAYIREMIAMLAAEPNLGSPIESRPNYWICIAKFRKRRSGHGHRILYTEIEGGILVVRILHTGMNWPDYLR